MFIVWGLELCCVVDIVDKVDVYCLLFGVWGFCWVVDMLTGGKNNADVIISLNEYNPIYAEELAASMKQAELW